MSEHTPGPWQIDSVFDDDLRDICLGYQIEGAGVPILIASTYWDEPEGRPVSKLQMLANARLIAAAPDLLAACIEVLEHAGDDSPEMWGRVMAAVAKAEGKYNGKNRNSRPLPR